MEIGNIITLEKINLGPEFKVYESLEDVVCTDCPTIIVGCELARTMTDEKLDFLERKIKYNLYWTFTKKEMRKHYHNDLEDFMQRCYEHSVKRLNYVYMDLIQYNEKSIKKIIKKLVDFNTPYSYKLNDMIYVYEDKFIIGVDLELVRFIGYDTKKIIDKIKSKSKVFLEGSEVLIEYNNYMERLDNRAKYIPFIYSINNYE